MPVGFNDRWGSGDDVPCLLKSAYAELSRRTRSSVRRRQRARLWSVRTSVFVILAPLSKRGNHFGTKAIEGRQIVHQHDEVRDTELDVGAQLGDRICGSRPQLVFLVAPRRLDEGGWILGELHRVLAPDRDLTRIAPKGLAIAPELLAQGFEALLE